MKEIKTVEMTPELSAVLEIRRLEDGNGGFQRKLRDERIRQMVTALTSGKLACPPIIVAKLPDGKDIVVDGQHRLEAWRKKAFPLRAMIFKADSLEDAAASFCAMNATARKVSLAHRIQVDPSRQACIIRNLARRYRISPSLPYHLVIGLEGMTSFYANGSGVTKESLKKARTILQIWSKGKLWKKAQSIYSTPGVLKQVGWFSRGDVNVVEIVRCLQAMDFRTHSPLAGAYGTSFYNQRQMTRIIEKFLVKQTLGR
jgi:ParB-like nuclease domain